MDIETLEAKAKQIFQEQKLLGWALEYKDGNRSFGECCYRLKKVYINRYYALVGPEEHVMDTFLHEVAHALTPGEKHNAIWKAMARKLGCSDKVTCGDGHLLPPKKFQAVCPNCKRLYGQNKRPLGTFGCSKAGCNEARLTYREVETAHVK
jgi:hypothetical protein